MTLGASTSGCWGCAPQCSCASREEAHAALDRIPSWLWRPNTAFKTRCSPQCCRQLPGFRIRWVEGSTWGRSTQHKCCASRNAGQDDHGAWRGHGPEDAGRGARGGAGRGAEEWSDWDDWGAEEDWAVQAPLVDEEAQRRRRALRRRRRRRDEGPPRDEFMRGMVDLTGVRDRLNLDGAAAEARLREEFEDNQAESRAALQFAGVLAVVPLAVGFIVSRLLADPFFAIAQRYNPDVFTLTDREKVEGARDVRKHVLRLRMEAAIGRAPPLVDDELQAEMRREALHLVEEFRERNRSALLNLLADCAAGTTLFAMLARYTAGRVALFNTIGRVFSGLSDTAKAFLIIASTDILLGYHSEEGWTAAIHLVTHHYGAEVEEGPIAIFVAIVPVTMDAIFKLWIFRGLNKRNPAAAVTLRNMDRH